MIGMLKGIVVHQRDSHLLIDVHGIGYKVYIPERILSSVKKDDIIQVFTHTHVREDILELYGFVDHADLELFEAMITVSGVGCRTALNVFVVGGREEIKEAIEKEDIGFFTAVPRLGKKNAQKLIIELKGKVGSGEPLSSMGISKQEQKEVIAALFSFGFSERESIEAFRAVSSSAISVEEKIRHALKYLGK